MKIVWYHSAGQIHFYAPDRALKKKNGCEQSKSVCTSDRETAGNLHFCSLLPK